MNWLSDLKAKIKADIANAVALVSSALGGVLAHIDELATTLGDPNLNQQFAAVVGDVKVVGKWMLFVGILTAVARFKKLVQTPPAA